MERQMFVVLALAFASACVGELGPVTEAGEAGPGGEALRWTLVADGDGALRDPAHPEFGVYPNPQAVDALPIRVYDDGRVCAELGDEVVCGGLLHGIPYSTRGEERDDGVLVVVVDMYGNEVASYETRDPAAVEALADQSGCRRAVSPTGEPCTLCTDGQGSVTSNSCVAPIARPDHPENPALAAARAFVERFNEDLARIGSSAELAAPELWELAEFDEGDITMGSPACADVLDYLEDEFADDHEGTDDWVFGDDAIRRCLEDGECRIGQLVTRAMAEACTQIAEGASVRKASLGVIGAGGFAISSLCPGEGQLDEFSWVERCVGSPLVIDVDDDGLALSSVETGADFDLLGHGATRTGWLAGRGDALLAVDLDGDGAITSGRELFGEATDGFARDGFEALARRDDNGDGVIDALDPVFGKLLAWVDDGDASSEPWELLSLASLGITAISLDAVEAGAAHPSGNELGLASEAHLCDGTVRPVVDVWFALATGR